MAGGGVGVERLRNEAAERSHRVGNGETRTVNPHQTVTRKRHERGDLGGDRAAPP